MRPMRLEDTPQVAEIEREAFPTTWPPTPFRKELQNRLASYLVAWIPWSEYTAAHASNGKTSEKKRSPLWRWLPRIRGLFSPPPPDTGSPRDYVVGYVGVWFMADEAHIVAIAVREEYQRLGLGELMMQGVVEMATARKMRCITLEARVSNHPAHALYEKYGFQRVGIRKGYYTDNHEDAVIMTAEDIPSASYQEQFRQLVESYRQRRGDAVRILA